MKLTEKMLLDGYECPSASGGEYYSKVAGKEICWTYRVDREDCQPVCDPEDATCITLEWDRSGEIPLDPACAEHPARAKIASDTAKIWGDEV